LYEFPALRFTVDNAAVPLQERNQAFHESVMHTFLIFEEEVNQFEVLLYFEGVSFPLEFKLHFGTGVTVVSASFAGGFGMGPL
jgi:hypothetical protein